MSQRPRTRSSRDDGAIRRPETKSFILTSEFWVAAAAAAAVFLAGYVLEDIADPTAWRYATWIAIAYIISRGIAKAGSQRSYQPEPTARSGEFWGDRSGEPARDERYRGESANSVPDRPAPMASTASEPTQRYDLFEEDR